MLPDNLDHLRGGMDFKGDHTRWPGSRQVTTVCVHTSMDVEQQSDQKTNNAIWDGVVGLWSRVAPLLSPWCARWNVVTGVKLNPVRWSRVTHSLAQR